MVQEDVGKMKAELNEVLRKADALRAGLRSIRPLDAEALRKIRVALDTEYTYESNRIEGNTLTLQETALVIHEGVTIGGKSMREHLEAINHAQAIEYIQEIARNDVRITEQTIKDIHAIILHGINREQAGRYRSVPVMITGSRHIPPQPYLVGIRMEQFISRYGTMEADGVHPILIAAFLHNELVNIHPFIDGNGRTSRLLMNLYLLSKGYTITSLKADDKSKQAYYTALERSHTENNPIPFSLLVAKAVQDSLERYTGIVGGAA